MRCFIFGDVECDSATRNSQVRVDVNPFAGHGENIERQVMSARFWKYAMSGESKIELL